ncbi:hypothetical protein HanXRQr2_Chr15g0678731 [Helianthus annuus]|uniref:Uncharacterized protein n=1 Tax=Helianthus annuus TaxID=4232 RepID=A0A9K3DXH9_HELAN|nr:hypothetical protein HanXRQr2_Chr15g0678731 [Helianthus annuus]
MILRLRSIYLFRVISRKLSGRSIWKMRNESLFSQKAPSIAKVVEEVKTLGFLRIRNRSRTLTMTWDD